MKKIVLGILTTLMFAGAAQAQIDCRRGVDHKHPLCYSGTVINVHQGHGHRHWHHRHGHPVIIHRSHDWVAPVVGGIIIGAAVSEISKQRVEPAPLPPNQVVCSEWKEVQSFDGTISRERICRQQ